MCSETYVLDAKAQQLATNNNNNNNKITKYASLTQSYSFIPIAAETMGAIKSDGIEFLGELGRRITRITNDKRESAFLFQRLSVAIQRYNAVAIQGTFAHTTPEDDF